MQKLQLYIANERIDLFKDEQVSFNQSIQNIKDPAKIFTEFTQTFTVPASKSNNQIFKHYYNFDIIGGFDARNKVDALIELNNITFKQGYIRLDGVDLKLNKPYAYRITFFGETVNLKDLLGDDKLGILSDLDQYKLDYDAANIKSKLQNTSNAILCPLITSGANSTLSRLYYDSGGHQSDATGNLWYQNGSHEHGVYWGDLKYAIRLYEIIEAITVQYPSLVFTDDFFSTSNAEFYNLHMWLHRKKGSVQPPSQITSYPTLIDSFPLSGASNKTTNVTGSAIIINAGLLPKFQQDLTLTTTNTTASYDVIVNRNGILFAEFTNNIGTKTFDKTQLGTMDAASYTVIVSITDPLGLTFSSIKWEFSGDDNGIWTDTYDTGVFQLFATFEFIITEQIPDMKIIDFLTGLFKMFNLTAYYVSDAQDADFGKIKVQKLDDFYTAGTSYDISKYVDVSTSQVNVALPYREIEFAYEGTGTLLALQYEQLIGKRWGAEQFTGNATVGNNFDAPNPIYKVILPFEHLQYERLIDLDTENDTTIQWGYFVDDNYEAYFGKPLLFYPIRQTGAGTTPISFQDDLTGTHTELFSYFIPSNSLSINPATSTTNINFYNERNEYTRDTDFPDTLFQNNYLSYIQDIFNSKRRIIKLKAYLPLKIIYNLNMNDTVTINNQDYTINTLQTNLITGESSMELLNEL